MHKPRYAFFFIHVLWKKMLVNPPLVSISCSQISGTSGNNLDIYLVWGENISSDSLYQRQIKSTKLKMSRSNSQTETHQVRALCWSYTPINRGSQSLSTEWGAGPGRNLTSANRTKRRLTFLLITLFGMYCSSVLYIGYHTIPVTLQPMSVSAYGQVLLCKITRRVPFTVKVGWENRAE